MTPLEIARTVAIHLDHNRFAEAREHFLPQCTYDIGGERLEGRDAIIKSYSDNFESASKDLDEIQFFSEVVPGEDSEHFVVKYLDRIRKGEVWHDHRCEQVLRIQDSKVTHVTHCDLPGEKESLSAFFDRVGL